MPYPTSDEFATLLFNTKHTELIKEHVFGGLPFAYHTTPQHYDALVDHLIREIGINATEMTVVGSGKIGFSLNPKKGEFGKPFNDRSDIDLLVASATLFDRMWLDMLRISRRDFGKLDQRDRNAIQDLKINDLYWGRLWPSRLVSVSESAKRWVAGFRSISRIPQLAAREINGRLYRTWDHAEIYHLDGLSQLMLNLRQT